MNQTDHDVMDWSEKMRETDTPRPGSCVYVTLTKDRPLERIVTIKRGIIGEVIVERDGSFRYGVDFVDHRDRFSAGPEDIHLQYPPAVKRALQMATGATTKKGPGDRGPTLG